MRLRAIGWLIRAAWWLARPRIGKRKICQHHAVVIEMKTTGLGACEKLDKAVVLVDMFEVARHQSEESLGIENAIDEITTPTTGEA